MHLSFQYFVSSFLLQYFYGLHFILYCKNSEAAMAQQGIGNARVICTKESPIALGKINP
jgi:hypothetical protein